MNIKEKKENDEPVFSQNMMKDFIESLTKKSAELLEEWKIKVSNVKLNHLSTKELKLKNLTSIITVEDIVKMTIAFSYDDELINKIFTEYTRDIPVEEDEIQLLTEETAGDMLNVVIGNVLGQFQRPGIAIAISIPIVINGARSISRFRNTRVSHTQIETDDGSLSIYCMIPGDSYSSNFNDK